MQGTVRWWDPTRGYGYIKPDSGGHEVFVHVAAVQRSGLRGLIDGQRVIFDLVTDGNRKSAANLRIE